MLGKMAAVVVPQIVYPLKLSNKDTAIFDAKKLEDQLIQQLNYTQTEASTLVDEITSLVREDKRLALQRAAYRGAAHLVNAMLQSADPSERLRFIQMQAGEGVALYFIALLDLESYRQILQSVSGDDERLQLLQMKNGRACTLLHHAADSNFFDRKILR